MLLKDCKMLKEVKIWINGVSETIDDIIKFVKEKRYEKVCVVYTANEGYNGTINIGQNLIIKIKSL
jgi:hypothetical protein